jgi:3-methyladenine DNA glycosylase AlkD
LIVNPIDNPVAAAATASIAAARFCEQIQAALAPHLDAASAQPMQAYMKHQFVFLGLPAPLRRKLSMPLLRAFVPASGAQLLDAAWCLWRLPQREYHYVAIDLLARYVRLLDLVSLEALLQLAQVHSWWDSVDGLAGVVGDLVGLHRNSDARFQQRMDSAIHDPNLWVRRIAMLHQKRWKADTDTTRLFAYARLLAPESDFFIRKAIGWALREYAHHDPQAVQQFLVQMAGQLSPLSVREAGKHLRA